jgi:hypothetical protein
MFRGERSILPHFFQIIFINLCLIRQIVLLISMLFAAISAIGFKGTIPFSLSIPHQSQAMNAII